MEQLKFAARGRLLVALVVTGAALTGGARVAQAQGVVLDEITVTGTRILERQDFQSATATQTVTVEDMQRLGLVSAADMLAQLPANVSVFTLDTTEDGQFFVGATLANLRGMNTGIGTRTLTLVDGRRFVSTNNGGGVDLSFIPSILISRMETVTGGGSATYGSDATAGVINVVLDRQVDGLRLDASYGQSSRGDFKNYSVAVAGGLNVLKGRGTITMSYEHQDTDPVTDCAAAREWCARSMRMIQTYIYEGSATFGCSTTPGAPNACPPFSPIPEVDVNGNPVKLFPGTNYSAQEVFEGVRYLEQSTTGYIHTNVDAPTARDATAGTFYVFDRDGVNLVEYNSRDVLDGLWRRYAYGNPTGYVVGGDGPLVTDGRMMRNGQERDNVFLRFNWNVTDDIELNAEVSYGVTTGWNHRNQPSRHADQFCIYLPQQATDGSGAIVNWNHTTTNQGITRQWGGPNAFIDPTAPNPMSDFARNVLLARAQNATGTTNSTCWINNTVMTSIPTQAGTARPGITLRKNWRDQVDAGVDTDTDVTRLSVGANGPVFGDKWNWDAHIQFGSSDRRQTLRNNKSRDRFYFALDSVIDPVTGQPVCRINSQGPEGETMRNTYLRYYIGEDFAETLDTTSAKYIEAKARVEALSEGCQPLNPFGMGYVEGDAADFARQQAAIAYAWDDLIEYSFSDQLVASASLSGEFWKGVGAGPFTMAVGVDYRDEETNNDNAGHPNLWVRSDFLNQYGNVWGGGTKATELFGEFELPLVRDRIGARSLLLNFTGRRTQNNTFRSDQDNDYDATRYNSSYRTSFVWEPVDWLRVRATRSADVRSPTPRELFFRQVNPLVGGGCSGAACRNPWRTIEATASNSQGVPGDTWISIQGANPNLRNELSTTRTLGLVFTPGGFARGLQLSIDYNELLIQGGISNRRPEVGGDELNEEGLNYNIFQCFVLNDPFWCDTITFDPAGSPEEPNVDGLTEADCVPEQPCLARTEILSIESPIFNSEPYWSRGFDFSATYNFRLQRGGTLSARFLATRTLEQNRCHETSPIVRDEAGNSYCGRRMNYAGFTGNNSGGQWASANTFFNYSSSSLWNGNFYVSYANRAFSVTTQFRYIGAARISESSVGPDDPRWCAGCLGTVSINALPSWTTVNLTTSYDFTRSRFAPERFENLQLSLTIDNLLDKQPDFYSAGSATGNVGGVNTRFYSGNGRTFRMNLRTRF